MLIIASFLVVIADAAEAKQTCTQLSLRPFRYSKRKLKKNDVVVDYSNLYDAKYVNNVSFIKNDVIHFNLKLITFVAYHNY